MPLEKGRWMLVNGIQISFFGLSFFVFPFCFCSSLTQKLWKDFSFFPLPVLLIHWKDSSHVISTFNLTNEASWLELIAFPQGHNSICNVHDQSPRALESGSRQGAIEDQKQPPFIFRACSKQILVSSRSCQSYKEPQRCTGRDFGWSVHIVGVYQEGPVLECAWKSSAACGNALQHHIYCFTAVFSPNTGRAHGCGTQCANGGHLSAFFRRKQRSRASNAEARMRAFLLHFHRSTSSQHHRESHSHSCATFLSAMKQPLMQVPQAWSTARFNWTMSSCDCVITVWGSNHTPPCGKHEWISVRGEGIICLKHASSKYTAKILAQGELKFGFIGFTVRPPSRDPVGVVSFN